MANRKKKEIGIIVLLLVAVAVMTIGFAAYSATLNIKGNLTVKGSPWKVHYDTSSLVQTADSVTPSPAPTLTDTDFSFTVTLAKPGDFYEATFKAWNEGTMTAYLKSLEMSSLTTEQAKYLSYTVTYGGTTYNASASTITGVSLAAGAKADVKVRVEYLEPANSSDLPSTDQTITVTGKLNYASDNT